MTQSLTRQIALPNRKETVSKRLVKPQKKYSVEIGKIESFESKKTGNFLLGHFPLLSPPYRLKGDYLILID